MFSCCAHVFWLKQQIIDYGLKLGWIPLRFDNTSAINLTKKFITYAFKNKAHKYQTLLLKRSCS